MIAIILIFLIIIPFMILLPQFAKHREADRKRRIEEYRKSPESHILHLND